MKMALCIKTVDAPKLVRAMYFAKSPQLVPIDISFFGTPTQLADRAYCETDVSLLQLLPYIVLEAPDASLFTYTRGGAGEEARLHGNYSVGVGGHVDNNVLGPDEEFDELRFSNLLDLLIDEADREIEEEIGFSCDTKKLVFSHFIADGTNSVGQVHLGLLCHYKLDDTEYHQVKKMILEDNVIVSGRFSHLGTLCDKQTFERLENWSKAVVTHIATIHANTKINLMSAIDSYSYSGVQYTGGIPSHQVSPAGSSEGTGGSFGASGSGGSEAVAGSGGVGFEKGFVEGFGISYTGTGGVGNSGASYEGNISVGQGLINAPAGVTITSCEGWSNTEVATAFGFNGPLNGPITASISGSQLTSTLNININTVPSFKDDESGTWFIDLEQLRKVLKTYHIDLTHTPSAASPETDTTGLTNE